MILPTIHLNGTSADALRDQYEAAWRAVGAAITALQDASPNGRDYYPQGPDAGQQAGSEHRARVEKLHTVMVELQALYEHAQEAVNAREERR